MVRKKKAKAKGPETGKEIESVKPARALTPFEEMDRWFGNFFHSDWMRSRPWEWPSLGGAGMPFEGRMPKVDVIDRDDEVLVRAEVPGVEKENIDISVTDTTVTIKGETSHETREEKGDYHRREISRGSFARTVAMPGDVDADQARAVFKDGVLELTLPKVRKAKRRSVKVD